MDKTFDSISHNQLLNILKSIGIVHKSFNFSQIISTTWKTIS